MKERRNYFEMTESNNYVLLHLKFDDVGSHHSNRIVLTNELDRTFK